MINGHIILHNDQALKVSLYRYVRTDTEYASDYAITIASARVENTVDLVIWPLHCFIELVSISGNSRHPYHGCFVENQHHEGVIGNSFPLAGEAAL